MAVISIIVTESETEIIAGIPRSIAIATNISASIFYTLDGSTPTLDSNIYVSPILMPTNKPSVTLKILASNGVDTSSIVSETYFTNIVTGTNLRVPHAGTTAQPGASLGNPYPFGTNSPQPGVRYTNSSNVGVTVDDPALPELSTGFDGDGYETGFTNEVYDKTNYSIIYSDTGAGGITGWGIGNLPATTKIIPPKKIPEQSDMNSSTFDPRALVIFQDVSNQNLDNPPHINRMHFNLQDSDKSNDGNDYYSVGLDAPPVNTAFVKSHYNPRTNEITYYYRDSLTNRWIISTQPYEPNPNWDGNLAGMSPMSGGAGARFVFEWTPFARRVLF